MCTEFARGPQSTSTFDTREACEEWVRTRYCQPGFRCFDGCNWNTCTRDGSTTISTLLGCSMTFLVNFEFQANTVKLNAEPDWAIAVAGVERALRPAERTVSVLGYTEPNEARGHTDAQKRLALQRAQLIVKELVKRGVAANRLVAKVGDASVFGARRWDSVLRRVRLELVPEWGVRDDFQPDSREYQEFCGANPRTE